jgi:cyclophilin family peptidyl-prolyl cis-trans isomerase
MSSSKQRKARQKAEREQWEREQQRMAAARRRRTAILSVLGTVVAVALVVALVVALTGGEDPGPAVDEAQVQDTEILASEAASDAQASAANEAMNAGEVVAEDFTVAPGTPVDNELKPPRDDRPVACGAKAPANVRASRPRYPGGPADVLRSGVDYVARIETSCGPITIDLLEEDAPIAVNSFVFLAQEGFYDGLEMYRDFGGIAAIQTGSGTNTVGWDVGYTLPDELDLAQRKGYSIGTVTTAATGPYTAGSEFYVAYGKEFDAAHETDRSLTTFGEVLSGMEVVETVTALERVGLGGEAFAERVFMEKVTIQER